MITSDLNSKNKDLEDEKKSLITVIKILQHDQEQEHNPWNVPNKRKTTRYKLDRSNNGETIITNNRFDSLLNANDMTLTCELNVIQCRKQIVQDCGRQVTVGEGSPFVKQTQEGTSEEPHYNDRELIDEHNNYVCEGETKDEDQIDGIPIQSLWKKER